MIESPEELLARLAYRILRDKPACFRNALRNVMRLATPDNPAASREYDDMLYRAIADAKSAAEDVAYRHINDSIIAPLMAQAISGISAWAVRNELAQILSIEASHLP